MADAVTAARARIDRALADLETKIAGLKAQAGVLDRDDDLFAPRGADSARVAELEAAGAQAAEALGHAAEVVRDLIDRQAGGVSEDDSAVEADDDAQEAR
ncbi:hypothetical protein [Brevundimonas sp. PAMC22021]|uniref:hypothetical protein n=1 Tax=Brevundimonas sp. PAMC22021 TaxID=2861285 RepID=UPI002103655F|nr:hypothetical protein [Brevundimonas sp. PAMC22021]